MISPRFSFATARFCNLRPTGFHVQPSDVGLALAHRAAQPFLGMTSLLPVPEAGISPGAPAGRRGVRAVDSCNSPADESTQGPMAGGHPARDSIGTNASQRCHYPHLRLWFESNRR